MLVLLCKETVPKIRNNKYSSDMKLRGLYLTPPPRLGGWGVGWIHLYKKGFGCRVLLLHSGSMATHRIKQICAGTLNKTINYMKTSVTYILSTTVNNAMPMENLEDNALADRWETKERL